ncbi:hypothetical protein [Rhodoferax sp. GW822-FHT02A01]|uniref:hypothetical protein n=1 Tax=Rhodoferax sp. GW822-FHT02A01 TaxID=3141537 RepID=UPI00315D6EB8
MSFRLIFAFFVSSLVATSTVAGVYSDTMGKCLVSSTTDQDKAVLVKWMFSEMALHPAIVSMTVVTPAQRNELNKLAGQLFNKLLTVDCKKESSEAIRYEGPAAMQSSFQLLGQVAVASLMNHPAVAAGFNEFGKYMDLKAIGELSHGN